jgi:hypothetical protein
MPVYFMDGALGRNFPPPLTHPEQFYGFMGAAISWLCAFLLIASHVQLFRAFMLAAVLKRPVSH